MMFLTLTFCGLASICQEVPTHQSYSDQKCMELENQIVRTPSLMDIWRPAPGYVLVSVRCSQRQPEEPKDKNDI